MFIPKPGRNSFSALGDFRLTSFTSFALKTMESLLDRHLRVYALDLVPLHPNQHGKDPSSAEKALDHQDIALGAFLDIEGAFNISYDSMCADLISQWVDQTIVWWIRTTLDSRLAAATFNGFCMRILVSRI